ncbi:MAG: threonine ammonia-lyase, partial [Armatimonadaceae bacterium]
MLPGVVGSGQGVAAWFRGILEAGVKVMVDLRTIEQTAVEVVAPKVRRTPLYTSTSVSEAVGCPRLWLKMENLQRTGSFKIRVATARIARMSLEERRNGVVAASAGNHAQGVALAARDAGVGAVVVMPLAASNAKVQATAGYGAEVVLAGANFDEAVAVAQERARETGAVYVSAYDDDAIIAGQGSLGLEVLDELSDVETVVIPIGGGGLFAGVATAVKERRPGCRVIGVQATGADTAARSFHAGRLLDPPSRVDTIADGIAIKSPSVRTFSYIQKYADDVVTVDDASIAQAILLLLTRMKVLVEPSGAASLAALASHPGIAVGKTVCLLCGGNLDVKLLSDIIERGLVRNGRYLHFLTDVPDRPGGLAALL